MTLQPSAPVHPRLTIHKVTRLPQTDPSDELTFSQGVNVLVGVPNTGKSKWLRMLDFILGGVIALLLLVYLVYALIRPERF